ncbi:hypothetical protein [Nocardia sp. NPDC050175]|uniref:hypothetical protein n=1 Tax=Nocardia sp. NPDC050175 TaxID=3364317 RepID=UPI00379047C4
MGVVLIAFAIGMIGIFASWSISVGLRVAGWALTIVAGRHVIVVAQASPDVVAEAAKNRWSAIPGQRTFVRATTTRPA